MNNKVILRSDLEGLKEIFVRATDTYGKLNIGDLSDGLGKIISIQQCVYEEDKYNKITDEELTEVFNEMEEYEGLLVNENYKAHCTLQVGEDNTLHMISINSGKHSCGYGTEIMKWIEKYAQEKRYSAVLIRSTEAVEMNNLAIKLGYIPAFTTIEERIEFAKKNGFRYSGAELKYDENGNLFGHWIKKIK